MLNFILGFLSSLLASFVFLLIITPRRKLNLIKILASFISFLKSGITCFYTNRKELLSRLGNVGEYIEASTKELIYIGYQLSHSLENDNILSVLKQKLNTGNYKVTIALLDYKSNLLTYYAKQYDLSPEYLQTKAKESISAFLKLKNDINQNYQKNIKVYVHEFPLMASCFIFDKDLDRGRILLDHKYSFTPRIFSYGLEISNSKTEYYRNILDSYNNVIIHGKEIEEI